MSALESLSTDAFEDHRPLLFGVAYRMLGSAAEAEDVVQDAYIRFRTARPIEIRSPRAYLVTIVTRLAMDVLRSARVRREQYIGQWLPEPIVTVNGRAAASPEWAAEQDESISMAFLVLMERLTPVERAVVVLREAFDYDYQEIAEVVRRSTAACRQLFHRAKQRLGERPVSDPLTAHDTLVLIGKFKEALAEGDVPAMMELIAPDATAIGDGGGYVPTGLKPVHGNDRIARLLAGLAAKFGPGSSYNWNFGAGEANGAPAVISRDPRGTVTSVTVFETAQGRIVRVFSVANPEKLRHW
jgi:RNA polymerase sigma-70 factor (ECF subfamily)